MASNETPVGDEEKRRTKDDGACAACMWQRRRCVRDCPLRPYFPADKPEQFIRVRDLFGVTKVTKMLQELPLDLRDDYMKAIISRALLQYYKAYAAAADADVHPAATTVANNPIDALDPVSTNNYFPGASADGTMDFISEGGYFGNFAYGNETTPLEGTQNHAQRQQQHGGVEDLRTLKRTAAAAFNPATDFYNPYTNTTINNNCHYYPGSISADGGKNGSFSGGGHFGNFREEEETRPFKRNQAQQQQFLDSSNGLDLFPARGNASFDNNENATYFLPDNAYAIQSLKNDKRANSMQKDDGNPFV